MGLLDNAKGFEFLGNKEIKESKLGSPEVAKSLEEDMLAVADSPSFQPVNPEQPGQVPSQMPTDMDIFALAGPGKKQESKPKKKKKEEKKSMMKAGPARISNFKDFMKNR